MMLRFADHIFDADGTLFDTLPNMLKSTFYAFKKVGVAVDPKMINKAMVRPRLRQMLDGVVPDLPKEKMDDVIDVYIKYEKSLIEEGCPFFPGVKEYLHKLKAAGKRLYIATARGYPSMLNILEKSGEKEIFDLVFAPDMHSSKNKILKPELVQMMIEQKNMACLKTIFYGDTLTDMEAAKKNGIKSVAALYGYENETGKLCEAADYHAKTPHQLSNPCPRLEKGCIAQNYFFDR